MKRWFLATAVLLGGTAGMASADYILIVANVGQVKDKTAPGQGQMGGPIPGQMGGPMPGQLSGPMPGGLRSPAPGQMGSPNPGGIMGSPNPGGIMGSPNPGGIMGSPNPGAQMGGPFPGQQGGPPPEGQPIWVVAVVEVDAPYKELVKHARWITLDPRLPPPPPFETHDRWGAVKLLNFTDPKPGPEIGWEPLEQLTVAKRYEAESARVFKDKSGQKPGAEAILALAEWALSHDLNDKFVEVMKKLAEDNKDLPAVQAFLKVQADLDVPLTQDAAVADLKKHLGDYKDATLKDGKGHYTLFHNLPSSDQSEVQERLARLEESLRTFYYYFALKGQALPAPKERMPALLTSRDAEFQRYRDSLSSPPIVGDGFFARRENLSVFCARPLDDRFEMLDKATMHLWTQGYNRFDLVTGKDNAGYPPKTTGLTRSYVGTIALLMKALEDESERAGISHDSTRQLLFASGLLPRGVTTPEWVQFGMGSFFETPQHAPWPTPTAPNSTYFPIFRHELGDAKGQKFEGTPIKTMQKIVTDGYFRSLSQDDLKKNSPELMKARAATWSLMYFLVKNKTDNLRRYFQLLGEMPRDLELDERVLWECFARAFDAYDPAAKRVDDAKLGSLAATWQNYVLHETLESEDLVKKVQDRLTEISPKEEGPKPPMPPGGVKP
jgi:Protein of unknown function (DUF1570)